MWFIRHTNKAKHLLYLHVGFISHICTNEFLFIVVLNQIIEAYVLYLVY